MDLEKLTWIIPKFGQNQYPIFNKLQIIEKKNSKFGQILFHRIILKIHLKNKLVL